MEDRCGLPFEVNDTPKTIYGEEIPVDPVWEARHRLNQAFQVVDCAKYLDTQLPFYRMALAVAAEKAKDLVTVLQKAEADAMENPGGR